MCCNKKISKYLLVALNSVFFILGLTLLIAGIVIAVDKGILSSVLSNVPSSDQSLDDTVASSSLLTSASYVVIALGAFIFLIGACGCFGALKEVKCLLIVYASIVLLLLVIQIAAAVVGFVYRVKVFTYMQDFLNRTISEKYDGMTIVDGNIAESVEPYSAAWDIAMMTLRCCGNYNYSDFAEYSVHWKRDYSFVGYNVSNALVPVACCKASDGDKLSKDLKHFSSYFLNLTECLKHANPMYTYTETCYEKIHSHIDTYSEIIVGVALGVAFIELICIIAAFCLFKSIGKEEE